MSGIGCLARAHQRHWPRPFKECLARAHHRRQRQAPFQPGPWVTGPASGPELLVKKNLFFSGARILPVRSGRSFSTIFNVFSINFYLFHFFFFFIIIPSKYLIFIIFLMTFYKTLIWTYNSTLGPCGIDRKLNFNED